MSVATTLSVPASLPAVRLDVSQGGRSVPYLFEQVDFLIGAVAGCDLRAPGADLPAVLCLLARHPAGVSLRRLAPTQVLLLNGAPVSRAELKTGDRITVGALDIHLTIAEAEDIVDVDEPMPPDLDDARAKLDAERTDFEKTRADWERERASVRRMSPREEIGADLLARELAVSRKDEELARKTQAVEARAAEVERHKQEIAGVRQELSDIRQQLHDRYQERRDRLAGLQESVNRAARKVQESKRQLEEDQLRTARELADLERRRADVDAQQKTLHDERSAWDASQAEIQTDLATRLADLAAREDRLAHQKQTLEARERQYQADLLRLDRRQGEIEDRERLLAQQSVDLSALQDRLAADSADLELQARELDELRVKTMAEVEAFQAQKAEHDARQQQLDQRAAQLEGQQTALMTLRGKLERMRDEFRQHDQALEGQRLAQDAIARQNTDKADELARLEADLKSQAIAVAADRQKMLDRQTELSEAVARINEAQARLGERDAELRSQGESLSRRLTEAAENEALLKGRLDQLADAQNRLDLERQALRERTLALAQTEQAREALQEQLRRRAEDLAQKQKQLSSQIEQVSGREAALTERENEMLSGLETARVALEAEKRVLDEQRNHLDLRGEELRQLEESQRRQLAELHARGQAIASEERALGEQQAKNQEHWRGEEAKLRQQREDLEAARSAARELLMELPDVELRAGAAVDRLSHAREQLRDHLAEVHAFVRQTLDDFAAAHAKLRHDEASLAQRDAEFRRLHEDHRQALVAFRQQIIDWQAQVKEARRLIDREDRGLENKKVRVDDKEKELDTTARELAIEDALLSSQKQTVAEQRNELDRHVGDLRDWYRRKMRELAGGAAEAEVVEATAALVEGEETPLVPTERDILSITGPIDPTDQSLATALVEQQLVDPEGMHALLVESRRQRRPLKQVLLASGAATAYQIAVVEAGQYGALALGPFRVVDRVKQSPLESIYRVFDFRRGREALVRVLGDDAAHDAVLPDEFRQRFTRLLSAETHVAGALEVLDIDGRPAVVEDWLVGLPASDWPPLAAAPGVCYRLLVQASLGLWSLHKNGLVHGRLTERSLLLTPQGVLKICGANEPAWLSGGDEPSVSPADDLRKLGQIVSGWCLPAGVRKGPRAKPLPEPMLAVVNRLQAADYPSVRELLDELERFSNDIPANPEAWDRLLRYVRDHAQPEAILRQSA